jgi:serine phosphatase RsbU (regulator of sigma subunit)
MRLISYIFILCLPLIAVSQNKKLDSLLLEEKKSSHDTVKAVVCSKIAAIYSKNKEFEKSDEYFAKAKILTSLNYKHIYLSIMRASATSLKRRENFGAAIDTLRKIIRIAKENKIEKELSSAYLEIGVLYRTTGNFKSSIENILNSIPIREKSGNKKDIMNAYNSLANSYSALGGTNRSAKDFAKAIEYYKKAEAYIESDPNQTAMILSNLGVTNGYIGRIEKDSNLLSTARSYHMKSFEIRKQLNDSIGMIETWSNIGVINFDLGLKYNSLKYLYSADYYFQKSIGAQKALDIHNYSDIANMAGNIILIGRLEPSKEKLFKGIKLAEEVLADAKKSKDYLVQYGILENLTVAYDSYGDCKMALYYAKESISMKDTLLNSESNNTIQELSTKFETDKKEQENQILKQQGELNATQLKQQKIVSYALIIGLIFLIVFAIMIYKNLNLSKKSNRIISMQKLEVEKQKHLVEEKQKEVLDSINYAKRLQDAILPQVSSIKESFSKLNGDAFVVYQPKDIVAGDFYFFEDNNEHVFIAAADCTGHGVPGAMVSVVCSNALSRSVKEFNLSDPGKILDKTTELVLDTFSKSVGQVKDGMDISLLCINKKSKSISWSGANNPLWYIEQGMGTSLQELKPNKQPIGQSDDPQPFLTQILPSDAGQIFYLITDGYADQFGGEDGKKLKSKNFKELLRSINTLPLGEQANMITQNFNRWKGDFEQVDDVCVIGIRI